ncbi:hypothetical protein E6H15_08825 [Candidatus Bathyarchaeota archaeon]|nr:MAG: hypothetical protein E6H15_08825 [Candidatus Bathyarchaeota archaeon]
MEHQLAINLQDKQISYLTQVDISVTIADFYFPLDPRPLLVFVDKKETNHTKKYSTTWDRTSGSDR